MQKFKISDNKVYFDNAYPDDAPVRDFVEIKGGITAPGFEQVYLFYRYSQTYIYGYLKDQKGIWWFDGHKLKTLFVTADTAHFQAINEEYAKDGHTVFQQGIPIPGSDPASFQVLEDTPYFARDKHQAYAISSSNGSFTIIKEADAATFTGCGWDQYAADKDYLFHYNTYGGISYSNQQQEYAGYLLQKHPATKGWWHPAYACSPTGAELIAHRYYRTANAVFYAQEEYGAPVTRLVRHAAPAAFRPLNENYATDGERIFFKWELMSGADAGSFTVVDERFGKDRHHIYYNGHPVQGADPGSFRLLALSPFFPAMDEKHVYVEELERTGRFLSTAYILQPLKDCTPGDLQILSRCWAKDRRHVYRCARLKTKADAATLEHLFTDGVNDWAKDRHYLYNANGDVSVKNIDGSSFVALNRHWGKDQQQVFCFRTGRVVPTAHAASFSVTDDAGGATDKEFIYTIVSGAIKKKEKKTWGCMNWKVLLCDPGRKTDALQPRNRSTKKIAGITGKFYLPVNPSYMDQRIINLFDEYTHKPLKRGRIH